jgi:hypothetical protein
VAAGSSRPDVFDSSTTIARSGKSAPITSDADADVKAPVGSRGREAGASGAAVPGATWSASAARALAAPWLSARTCTSQPAGTRSLGMPGYAKKDTGDLAPASTRCLAPLSWAVAASAK